MIREKKIADEFREDYTKDIIKSSGVENINFPNKESYRIKR